MFSTPVLLGMQSRRVETSPALAYACASIFKGHESLDVNLGTLYRVSMHFLAANDATQLKAGGQDLSRPFKPPSPWDKLRM